MHHRGLLILLAAAGALGAVPVLEKYGLASGAPPAAFTLARSLAALTAVAIPWAVLRPSALRTMRQGRTVLHVTIVGSIGSGLVLLLSIVALTTTEATNKGVVQALYPAATVAFAWVLYRRVPSPWVLPALGLIVVGLVLLTSRGLGQAPRPGDWLLLLTVPLVGRCPWLDCRTPTQSVRSRGSRPCR